LAIILTKYCFRSYPYKAGGHVFIVTYKLDTAIEGGRRISYRLLYDQQT
jgi:hypothetical protein